MTESGERAGHRLALTVPSSVNTLRIRANDRAYERHVAPFVRRRFGSVNCPTNSAKILTRQWPRRK
jgi:hypothetical protein